MASFNKVVIVGYLGRDPEIRYTPQGTAVCNFSIATTEKRKGRDGEAQEITTWFRVQVWGASAEACNTYLTKGKQVYVEGRLRQEEYTDKEGNKRTTLEVNANEVQFLGSKGDSEPSASAAAVAAQAPTKPSGNPQGKIKITDDDIPF